MSQDSLGERLPLKPVEDMDDEVRDALEESSIDAADIRGLANKYRELSAIIGGVNDLREELVADTAGAERIGALRDKLNPRFIELWNQYYSELEALITDLVQTVHDGGYQVVSDTLVFRKALLSCLGKMGEPVDKPTADGQTLSQMLQSYHPKGDGANILHLQTAQSGRYSDDPIMSEDSFYHDYETRSHENLRRDCVDGDVDLDQLMQRLVDLVHVQITHLRSSLYGNGAVALMSGLPDSTISALFKKDGETLVILNEILNRIVRHLEVIARMRSLLIG